MSFDELMALHGVIADNRDLIINTWNFFASVHLALFAALVISPRPPGARTLILLLIPVYWGFLYLNYRGQVDNYNYSKALFALAERVEARAEPAFRALGGVFEAGWVAPYLPGIYIFTGALSTLVLAVSALGSPVRSAANGKP